MRWRLVSFMEDNWQHKSVIKSLKLGHHHLMNQVRQVLVQSCSNLRLGLDLVIESTILPTRFNQANAAKTFRHRNNSTHPPLMKEFLSKLFKSTTFGLQVGVLPTHIPFKIRHCGKVRIFLDPGPIKMSCPVMSVSH